MGYIFPFKIRRPMYILSATFAFTSFSLAINDDSKFVDRINASRDFLDLSTRYTRAFSTLGAIIAEYKLVELLAYNSNNPIPTTPSRATDLSDYWSLASVHERSAKRLLALCQKNGGVFIKIGQHLSTLDYLIPVEYCQTLKCLQDKAPKTSIEEVFEVICESLNVSNINEVFSSFEAEPVGIASLAQVHKAILKGSDQVVAVKVQHPLVERFAPLDIRAIGIFAGIIKNLFPNFTLQWLAEEVAENLPKEIDFLNEASNAIRTGIILDELNAENVSFFATLWSFLIRSDRCSIQLCVPKPFLEISTKKVLVMEFFDDFGIPIYESAVKSQAMEAINRCFTNMIFKYGWVHCDPHPGNFKLVKSVDSNNNYKLAILDHGLYRKLTDDTRSLYAILWLSLIEGDEKGIIDSLQKLCIPSSHGKYSNQLIPFTNDGQKAHRIVSSILSRRSWKTLEFGIGLSSKNPPPTVKRPRVHITPDRLGLVTFIFESIQRDLLLVLKTNDLLVSLNFLLCDSEKTDPLLGYFTAVGLACVKGLKPKFSSFKGFWMPVSLVFFCQGYFYYYFRLFKYQLLRFIY